MFSEMSTLLREISEHPGEAFRSVLPIVLVGTVVVIGVHLALALFGRRPTSSKTTWNLWERLVYLVTLGSVAVLAATSFFAILRFDTLEGWLLFAHMFGAGAFVFVLPVLAITWCEASRFVMRASRTGEVASSPQFFWFPKVVFWIMLASGLTVALTMLLSMLPLFGTEGLHELLDIHRYSGLVVVVATVFHFYSVLLQRMGLR